MTKKTTKRERYPLHVEPIYNSWVVRNTGDDYPSYQRVLIYRDSRHEAEVALLRLYKRVALREGVAQKLGIHPLEKLPTYADGGYPLAYVARDGGDHDIMCARCAEKERAIVMAAEVHWEGPPHRCGNCGKSIESAYGDPTEPEPTPDPEERQESEGLLKEMHTALEEWFNPRDGTPQYFRETALPALNLIVSTVNNRICCETAIFEPEKTGHFLWLERHETTDDLDAHHQRIVALAQDGQLKLNYEYSL